MDGAIKVRAGLAASARNHGADAVHLASGLAINDPDLVVAVWDRPVARRRARGWWPSRTGGSRRGHPSR
jgi:hypothetical protein